MVDFIIKKKNAKGETPFIAVYDSGAFSLVEMGIHTYHVMPRPLSAAGLTNNGFKDRRLTPQITTSLFGVLRPCSHAAWETSQEVTYPKIAPQ